MIFTNTDIPTFKALESFSTQFSDCKSIYSNSLSDGNEEVAKQQLLVSLDKILIELKKLPEDIFVIINMCVVLEEKSKHYVLDNDMMEKLLEKLEFFSNSSLFQSWEVHRAIASIFFNFNKYSLSIEYLKQARDTIRKKITSLEVDESPKNAARNCGNSPNANSESVSDRNSAEQISKLQVSEIEIMIKLGYCNEYIKQYDDSKSILKEAKKYIDSCDIEDESLKKLNTELYHALAHTYNESILDSEDHDERVKYHNRALDYLFQLSGVKETCLDKRNTLNNINSDKRFFSCVCTVIIEYGNYDDAITRMEEYLRGMEESSDSLTGEIRFYLGYARYLNGAKGEAEIAFNEFNEKYCIPNNDSDALSHYYISHTRLLLSDLQLTIDVSDIGEKLKSLSKMYGNLQDHEPSLYVATWIRKEWKQLKNIINAYSAFFKLRLVVNDIDKYDKRFLNDYFCSVHKFLIDWHGKETPPSTPLPFNVNIITENKKETEEEIKSFTKIDSWLKYFNINYSTIVECGDKQDEPSISIVNINSNDLFSLDEKYKGHVFIIYSNIESEAEEIENIILYGFKGQLCNSYMHVDNLMVGLRVACGMDMLRAAQDKLLNPSYNFIISPIHNIDVSDLQKNAHTEFVLPEYDERDIQTDPYSMIEKCVSDKPRDVSKVEYTNKWKRMLGDISKIDPDFTFIVAPISTINKKLDNLIFYYKDGIIQHFHSNVLTRKLSNNLGGVFGEYVKKNSKKYCMEWCNCDEDKSKRNRCGFYYSEEPDDELNVKLKGYIDEIGIRTLDTKNIIFYLRRVIEQDNNDENKSYNACYVYLVDAKEFSSSKSNERKRFLKGLCHKIDDCIDELINKELGNEIVANNDCNEKPLPSTQSSEQATAPSRIVSGLYTEILQIDFAEYSDGAITKETYETLFNFAHKKIILSKCEYLLVYKATFILCNYIDKLAQFCPREYEFSTLSTEIETLAKDRENVVGIEKMVIELYEKLEKVCDAEDRKG